MNYMYFIRPLSVVLFCLVARNISDLQISNIKFFIWVAASYVVVGFALLIGQTAASIAAFIMILAMLFFNGLNILPSLLSAMLTVVIMAMCNTATGVIFDKVYSDVGFYDNVADDFVLFTSSLALNYVFSITLSKTLKLIIHKKLDIKSVGSINRRVSILFFAVNVLVFLFVYTTTLFGNGLDSSELLFAYIVFFVFLMIFTYFVLNSSIKETELKSSETELKRLSEYTENIELMYNDIRSIRHDYANVISSMIGYLDDDDMNGLKEYLENEIIPFSGRIKIADNNLGVLSKIKEPSLKGTAAVKFIRAQEKNIPFLIDIKDDINIKSVKVLDLNRIVGILLDNALEASEKTENPYIHVGLIKNLDTITIAIINKVDNDDININKIFEQGYSTKGIGRGYGLSNIINILDKYPNVLLDTVVEDEEFKQMLHIEEKGEENNA